MNKKSAAVMNWRNRTKLKLIEYKGGCCSKCGYNKEIPSAYDFHHTDPKKKDFAISGCSWSFDRLKKEVDKCILVCRNCHAEIHHDLTQESRLLRLELKKKLLCKKKCPECCNIFTPRRASTKYCSKECCDVVNRKAVRPSKKELAKLLWSMPTVKIAEQFGVSDKAIEKWAKSYGIDKPPRGYWSIKR